MLQENKSGNASAAQAGFGDAAAKGGSKAGSKAAALRSCLDALWELLQRRDQLQQEQPAVLAKLLQVLSAFWQSSGAAFRAVAVLQRQPELWGHITGLLEAAGKGGQLALPALRGGEADEGAAAVAWADQEPAAALVAAEAYALQILAAECYTWASASSGGGGGGPSPSGMPAPVAALLRRLPAQLVPRLLERYTLPLPTAGLLGAAQQAAASAGLQLLGAALSDEALWRSMAEGPSLASQLAAAAQPLLQQFGSQAEAARVLADHAAQIAARNFRTQRSAVAVAQVGCRAWEVSASGLLHCMMQLGGHRANTSRRQACLPLLISLACRCTHATCVQLVMQQGEVPERVAADREFGAAFVYDSQLFHRRIGAVLVQQLDQLQGLAGGRRGKRAEGMRQCAGHVGLSAVQAVRARAGLHMFLHLFCPALQPG